VDGEPTNDDYVGSSYVGYDARADIDDVQQIEIIRGPGSALYGTGAFFGVINLVTRDRDAPTHGEVAVSTADNGVAHARATAAGALLAGQRRVDVRRRRSWDRPGLLLQEYASDPATGGYARQVDGFQTETVNGRIWYKALTAQWLLTSRDKTLPSGEFETIFGDPRTHFVDTRGLLELRFEPKVSDRVQLLSRAHVNLYNFDDTLAYTPDAGGPAHEAFRGRWVGVEQRAVFTPVCLVSKCRCNLRRGHAQRRDGREHGALLDAHTIARGTPRARASASGVYASVSSKLYRFTWARLRSWTRSDTLGSNRSSRRPRVSTKWCADRRRWSRTRRKAASCRAT